METLRELLAPDRRGADTACRVGKSDRVYDYDRFVTTAWTAGNYLRHFGVGDETVVGIGSGSVPEPLFAALGTGLLGGMAWFDPPLGADLTALVVSATDIETYDEAACGQRLGYGGTSGDPSIERFEEGLAKENPTIPPERPPPGEAVLTDGNEAYTQRGLLAEARRFTAEAAIDEETSVVLRSPLGGPETFVGAIGTLLAAATIVFPRGGADCSPERILGDVAIGDGPEPRVVRPDRLAP